MTKISSAALIALTLTVSIMPGCSVGGRNKSSHAKPVMNSPGGLNTTTTKLLNPSRSDVEKISPTIGAKAQKNGPASPLPSSESSPTTTFTTTSTTPPSTFEKLPTSNINCIQSSSGWTSIIDGNFPHALDYIAHLACTHIDEPSIQVPLTLVTRVYGQAGFQLPNFSGAICGGGTRVPPPEVRIGEIACTGGGNQCAWIYEGGGYAIADVGWGAKGLVSLEHIQDLYFVVPTGVL